MYPHITHIVYQPRNHQYPEGHADAFHRIPAQSVTLRADYGIEGDHKAGRNPRRQINILSDRWLAEMDARGYDITPGAFGEQITVTGIDLDTLPQGTIITLGPTQLKIIGPRDGCSRLESAQAKAGLAGQPIGVMTQVLVGGEIKVGDMVRIQLMVTEEK
ncbi:MAG TPA: MOSC domain-containing protein [Anaerolineae bacterium]|nr:MOSC domain-containing protein [Anaerolineae bacterium]